MNQCRNAADCERASAREKKKKKKEQYHDVIEFRSKCRERRKIERGKIEKKLKFRERERGNRGFRRMRNEKERDSLTLSLFLVPQMPAISGGPRFIFINYFFEKFGNVTVVVVLGPNLISVMLFLGVM